MELNIIPLEEWPIPSQDLLVSAGPCSAESQEQLMDTAQGIAAFNVGFFRAGIWKPRTKPGSFEGVGEQGLAWLVHVREETGLPVGTEVAYPEHVRACLDHSLDVLWIGARTTTNPFAVQALADALKGSDIPVFVKNPLSADTDLWVGAIQRLYNSGLRRIGAIHRGFSTARRVLYRNDPNWKIPIELKRQIPGIPLICDPSHICGDRELIFSVAQEALDLLFDGLMIEVHRNPSEAKSDASQQLNPEQFKSFMERLSVKRESGGGSDYQTMIRELRHEVDALDDHVIKLLAKRMDIAEKMGILKNENNISVLQPSRWREILESRSETARKAGLSEEFIFEIYQLIHEESINRQEPEVQKAARRMIWDED